MDKQTTLINRATSTEDGKRLWSIIIDALNSSNKPALVTIEEFDGSIGKWGMSRLWRSWMTSTANFMAANGSIMPLMTKANGDWYGKRPFNEKDAHELFTSVHLGNNKEGKRLSWAKSGDNVADKGQRFMACLKHEQWMVDKGIKFLIPRDSEFFKEKQKADGQS
jgi:hypothetical protein